jgi:hypothetical protein
MHDQQAARDQLVKNWTTYPGLAKERCVQPQESRSAYVEWLTCIEMTRDVLKMRKEKPAYARASGTSSRQCPFVNVGEDGNILSVIVC